MRVPWRESHFDAINGKKKRALFSHWRACNSKFFEGKKKSLFNRSYRYKEIKASNNQKFCFNRTQSFMIS